MNDKPVVVTGAAGFVGRHLVARLRALGARVTCLMAPLDAPPEEWRHEAGGILPSISLADVTDPIEVTRALDEARPLRIFHLAAKTARTSDLGELPRYMRVNAEGTACVLAACTALNLPLEGIVTMGSGEEYGPDATPPMDEAVAPDPRTPYGISKAAASLLCRAAWRSVGLPVVVLRAFLLYGPRQSTHFFVPQLLAASLSRKPMDMTGGKQARDFLHVADAVDAIILASGCHALRGEVANLCTGEEHTLQEIVRIWENLVGMKDLVRLGALPYRRSEIFHYVGNPRKLREATGWKPRIAIQDGLAELAAAVH